MRYRKGNKVLEIFRDEEPDNPREWNETTEMICFHKSYELGDKTDLKSDMFSSWNELEQYLVKERKAKIIFPIYMLDHSGITISLTPFSCPWDSGQIGYIYITEEKMKEFDLDEEKANKLIRQQIKEYDQYLTGDTYFYNIYEEEKCKCCGHINKEIVDSCRDFFGSDFQNNGLYENAGIKIEEWEEI